MMLVVKLGGHAVEEPRRRRALARQIAELARAGHRLVVVHGGGKLLTQTLARLGIPTEFYRGLRVTDAATRDVALMVLAGIVNKSWVAALEAQGQPALGLCGGDAGLVRARRLALSRNGKNRSLGFVGRPEKVNPRLLETLFREGIIPVVASLALGAHDEYLNVNADDFAAAIATALKADRLFYLTESGGVRDAERRLLRIVKVDEIPSLIARGVVRDGMIPKLQSCARTLGGMRGEISIISPDHFNVLLRAMQSGGCVGTRIVKAT